MLELYDAKVSCEDANLKFLRSLPSVWHVVATMIRGQPGCSNSQSIAFMSAEIKGSTSRQSTADDKSDIRWQVAMITARIRKFVRKTGRPIDLKPKNGITFDKSKIECFNCQELGHFARECKFAKYQANRANGNKEKRLVPIEDSNLKALVAKDSEGVDYDEVFAPVSRIEAIRLFLAFASFMGFSVYQMDVKSAFLYGNITEEVYVNQPPGFVDPHHPNKVYKVIKALYGLHQAPRAWYERLSTFLLKHGYRRGAIDKTLFIKKDRKDIMLGIIFELIRQNTNETRWKQKD
ncbi:putative ribonuclease H-like domain-containing protein, partial [Tanacetum coccineum]